MGRAIIYSTIIGLGVVTYLLIAGGGPGPRVPGSLGALYILWFCLVGGFWGALFGYLFSLGYIAKAPTLWPDGDAAVEPMFLGMIGLGMMAVQMATNYATNDIPGLPYATQHYNYLGGGPGGRETFAWFVYFPAGAAFLVVVVTSPFWLFWALVGMAKLLVFLSVRPSTVDLANAMSVGQNVPTSKIVEALDASLPLRIPEPPVGLAVPGASYIIRWREEAKAKWASIMADRFEASARAADAVAATERARAEANRHKDATRSKDSTAIFTKLTGSIAKRSDEPMSDSKYPPPAKRETQNGDVTVTTVTEQVADPRGYISGIILRAAWRVSKETEAYRVQYIEESNRLLDAMETYARKRARLGRIDDLIEDDVFDEEMERVKKRADMNRLKADLEKSEADLEGAKWRRQKAKFDRINERAE